jgi:hypothetical protein
MGLSMPEKITTSELWLSTLLFGGAAILILMPLRVLYRSEEFERSGLAFTIASAIFWGATAMIFIRGFWDIYYQYFYPGWMRSLAPLSLLLYAGFGFGLWWLSLRLQIPPLLSFVALGGLQGILEHLFGIYALGILRKTPFLRDISVLPIVIFSFWEYVLYWGLVAWLTFGLMRLWRVVRA